MPDPMVAKLQDWLKAHEQELLDDTIQMLRIPSIESQPLPDAPYGAENRQALDFALQLGGKFGMKTHELEGHIGWAEFGSGDRLVMSLGHLDVVPVGPGWKHEPFGAEIDEGYIYARGSTDDKGPTMASFYAARAIHECFPNIPARIRQVFGCNEESGFGCVHRYMETEEAPTFGVAPDSGWPLYHAEKGIANLIVTLPLNDGAEMELIRIEGGQRPNIVIDSCEASVRVKSSARKEVEAKLADSWDRNLTFKWDGDVLKIQAIGKACHGSFPFGGDNAAIRILRFLNEISPLSCQKYFQELFLTTHISGPGLGIHGEDEVSHDLTNNLGIVETSGDHIVLTFNVRYPTTWKGEKLREMCEKHLATLESGFKLSQFKDSPSLYFPLDHPLVKTVCEVYEEETGESRKPGVMGGGTYARAIPNTVSIGTGWEGDGHAHETDERLKVEHLFKMSRIYAHILYRLAVLG
ncbi:MAG TPA: Sapep family Mn(2+)-dependent dipeptidase [Fimbriimonadaceae bacterium]|nr:Sapep family Mn(2+)-dependent dipeptidase [Fimbriimonadaceae bacterium]